MIRSDIFFEEQKRKEEALETWFGTPHGLRVSRAFSDEMGHAEPLLRGHHLLQIGQCGEHPWLSLLRFRYKWIATLSERPSQTTMVTSMLSLPLERKSMDCIIAPLTMETWSLEERVLDEMDRILKPQGHLVFFGVNPWSFWGAAWRFGVASCYGRQSMSPCSSLWLLHKMRLRGYHYRLLTSFYFIPPMVRAQCLERLDFLNQMGKMLWPYPAGFYCLVVQKKETCPASFLFSQPSFAC